MIYISLKFCDKCFSMVRMKYNRESNNILRKLSIDEGNFKNPRLINNYKLIIKMH